MSTLLLRLAGPLQSWGDESQFTTRETRSFPTRSGVVGLVASALGRSRDANLDDLNELAMAVRQDRPGRRVRDFHTAREKGAKNTNVTYRHYVADAVFLVGLEGDESQLRELDHALRHPVYPLFLGRRSCPPTMPLTLGIRPLPLVEALEQEPWQGRPWVPRRVEGRLRSLPTQPSAVKLQAEAVAGEVGDQQRDVPVSFDLTHRRYAMRAVTSRSVTLPGLTTRDFFEAVES